MGQPSASDPLGQLPNPTSVADMLEGVIDARIRMHLRGRVSDRFNDVSDVMLVQELLARGWAVFRPQSQGEKS